MKEKADLVRGWLRKTQSDALAMNASLEAGAFDAACFHAQQGVEKSLKAYLLHRGIEFPLTHNLAKLVELASQEDESFRSVLSTVEPLTPYAVELRYDQGFWPTEEVAQAAAASAESVIDFVLQRLPPDLIEENP